MAFSVDQQEISDEGPTVKQALADMAIWCEQADEAKPLFEALLERLRTARDEVQRFYDTTTNKVECESCLKVLTDELETSSNELRRYFGVRELTATVEPGVKTFASRVLQHKRLWRELYEIHGGDEPPVKGLNQLFLLLKADEKKCSEWRDPFRAAVQVFEKAVADNVEKADMVGVYKRDALLALEAVTLLSKEELSQNIPADHLLDMLRKVEDGDAKELPSWFIPKDQVTCNQTHFANGSFSTVHYGTWRGSDAVIKCLVMRGDAELDAALRKAFIDEAKLWHELKHPHVLNLYGACHVATPPFFVCEVSTEGDLSEVLKRDRSKMWRLLYETALGIEYLHGKNFVHGDLKLNNILVGKDGHARVADFGMSRYKLRSRNLMLTALDPVMGGSGALRWCAPEALEAKAQIESDVYSFGMRLIEAVSGKIPYKDVKGDDKVRGMIRNGKLPEQLRNMDYPTRELVKRMTVFDRSKRPKIREIVVELNKRKEAEFNYKVNGTACTESKGGKKAVLRSELNGTVCPKCSNKLKNGSPVCQMCKSSASTQVVTDSKEY